jgi:pimeloyl-ACP methyl ester carboxylesterase
VEVGEIETNLRRVGDAPILYVHGSPAASWEWEPFLAATGGVAPDLPGFGESGKPNSFDYTIAGYGRWLGELLDALGLGRVSLVVHGWGAVAFALGDRVERLVVIGQVPFEPGYEWSTIERRWRTPLVGELAMGFTNRRAMKRRMPAEIVDRSWQDFDHGTQRAMLKLHRAAGTADRPQVPTLEIAGDWPWLGDPGVVERVAHFLRS